MELREGFNGLVTNSPPQLRMPSKDTKAITRSIHNYGVEGSWKVDSAQIATVGELVQRTEEELLGLRAFGKTSLREVFKKLEEINLELGMDVPEAFRVD